MSKSTPFNPNEVIRRAQTEIICALLRLLFDDKPVIIQKLYKYTNPNSGISDGYLIDSVRLTNDYHNVEVTVRDLNYDAVEDVDEAATLVEVFGVGRNEEIFISNPRTFILKEQEDAANLNLLSLIYTEAEKALQNGN